MRRLLLTGAAGGIATVVRPVLRELGGGGRADGPRRAGGGSQPGRALRRRRPRRPGAVGRRWPRAATRSCTSARCPTRRRSTCSPARTCTARSTSTRPRAEPACGGSSSRRRVARPASTASTSGSTATRRRGRTGSTPRRRRSRRRSAGCTRTSSACEVVALRIGTFVARPRSERELSTWLSHGRRAAPRPGGARPARSTGFLCRLRRVGERARLVGPAAGARLRAAGRRRGLRGDVEPGDGIPYQGGASTRRDSGGWAVGTSLRPRRVIRSRRTVTTYSSSTACGSGSALIQRGAPVRCA